MKLFIIREEADLLYYPFDDSTPLPNYVIESTKEYKYTSKRYLLQTIKNLIKDGFEFDSTLYHALGDELHLKDPKILYEILDTVGYLELESIKRTNFKTDFEGNKIKKWENMQPQTRLTLRLNTLKERNRDEYRNDEFKTTRILKKHNIL